MDLSVVIPIYNEEENISVLYTRVKDVLDSMHIDYELFFVNDGSKDRSMDLIEDLASKDSRIRYIDLSRNFGHQVAVTAGLDHVVGERVVVIDADLQDPPELIVEMYNKMNENFQVVYARRRSRKGEGFFKKFTAKLFYRILSSITTIEIPLDTGDFRIVDRKVVDVLKQMPEQHKFLRGQISWIGFNQTYVEYDREERHGGNTGYTYIKMLRFAIDGITSFSNLPLKLASLSGFVVSGLAFVIMMYTLYIRFFHNDYVQGWTSLMLSVMFIGGIQLICVGIIGEYISRISTNVRNRPLYIKKKSNF